MSRFLVVIDNAKIDLQAIEKLKNTGSFIFRNGT